MGPTADGGRPRAPVAIVTTPSQLPVDAATWGGERTLDAARREAPDWLTLCRLVGWHPTVAYGVPTAAAPPPRCLLFAVDPELVTEQATGWLAQLLHREEVLVVARAAADGTPFARLSGAASVGPRRVGGPVRWIGPGPARTWLAWPELEVASLRAGPEVTPWALIGDVPLLVARRVGRGHVVSMAAHPSLLRDAAPPGTGVLRHLLLFGTPAPIAWIDLEHTLVLRMDDPGSAARTHLRTWRHPTLRANQWARVAADLRARNARISVGYVSGWADDGDPRRGTLRVAGHDVHRVPGGVHPSPLVRYDEHGPAGLTHDHVSECRGLRQLRACGAGDLELHGYTHVRDVERWARAEDRYLGVHWFRELEGMAGADATAAVGDALRLAQLVLHQHFATRPVALLCPGDACSEPAGVAALGAGLDIVAAESLGIRHRGRLCWTSHVLRPYLDGPHGCWFESGLPVIGCFHDRDIGLRGPGWLAALLDQWQGAGARRLIDFRALAGMLARKVLLGPDERPVLEAATADTPPLVGTVPVQVRTRRGAIALWSMRDEVDLRDVAPDVSRRVPARRPRRRAHGSRAMLPFAVVFRAWTGD